jgi:hypothetical protein
MSMMDSYDRGYDRFQLIINGPALFNAVVTALELDLFRFLAEHPQSTVDEVRAFTGLPPHQLRVLLFALCATELVHKADGRYTNAPVADELLTSTGPDSWRHILLGWQRIYYPAFAQLTPALRAGTNTALASYPGAGATLYQRLAADPPAQAILHASMSAFTLQSMPALLDSPHLGGLRHLLDVGGGDGTTAVQIARRYPDLQVTVFDMPSVTELAAPVIPPDLADRVRIQAGDMFADPFPTGVDAVLFSHVLEVFAPEKILTVLGKAFDALPDGGRLLLYGFNAADEESRGVLAARLSLYLTVLATGEGMAYPASDYERWLRQVGCTRVESVTDLPYEHGLTVGTKAV